MALNHYITLGRSGLRVSPLCLGTMTFGEDWGWGSTVKESESILDVYISRGGNFLDTANMYTRGHSEKIIGDHISRHRDKRNRLVIATKFFGSMRPGDPNAGGAGRKNIMESCEQSLRRLQTDYIDLYWMHSWEEFTPIEETMRALDDLVKAGKVRYIGFSDTPAWKTAQAQTMACFRGWAPLIALQIEYSLLERTVEGELIPMAVEMGLGITPWGPLRSGVLSGKYKRGDNANKEKAGRGEWVMSSLNDHAFDVIEEVVRIADEVKTTPSLVALKWLQLQKGVSSIIIGARSLKQVEDNLDALDIVLTSDQVERLSKVSKPALNFPHDFLLNSGMFRSSDTTINGETSKLNPLSSKDPAKYY